MNRDCEKCARLWREYADAIAELTEHVEAAGLARQAAREAIRRHEVAEHSKNDDPPLAELM
jgi:heme oxygenase